MTSDFEEPPSDRPSRPGRNQPSRRRDRGQEEYRLPEEPDEVDEAEEAEDEFEPPPTTLLDTSRAAGVRPRREPLTGEVLGSRRERGPYEPPPDQPMLRNPYVVAGFAVAGAIVLAVLVVILFGSSGGGLDDGDNLGGLDPLTPQPGLGLIARSIATATVREGPSTEFVEIGTLRAGQDIEVVGRDDNARWFQIVFPPRSTLKGWVQSSALRIPEASIEGIPVVASTPIPRPTVILPTSTPGPTETPTGVPTETATPSSGPDLAAAAVPGTCRENRELIISVVNLGPAPIVSRAITVLVQSASGQQRAVASQTVNLGVNDVVDINTGYEMDDDERVVAIVDPLGALGDPNADNNRVDCVTTESGQQATPTTAAPPPIATATP